ncbi:hypothetical protein QYM36_001479 [Artemia franciscana]|uniref:Reverse transcriptase domain-containing protein n=1 Tax=Artemia franciscana TaxID=6661 RepID=A0AA88ID83_ARTSF|nr:hypothetical protein QYM36_001479 [Artemia franciscana]
MKEWLRWLDISTGYGETIISPRKGLINRPCCTRLPVIAGDLDVRVGLSDTTHVLGKFGLGHRWESGQRLVNYALMNHLGVTNIIFQHKPSHLLTWHSNDSVTKAKIYFILVHQRWRCSVIDSRSYNGADTCSKSGSDYKLVHAKIPFVLHIEERINRKPESTSTRQNHSLGELEYTDDVAIFSDPEKAQTMLDEVVTLGR